MQLLHLEGIKLLINFVSKNISPWSILSNPETILNKVDFPQPEGPTKTINSPSFISMLNLLITLLSPKDFSRFLITIFDICNFRGF